MSIQFADSFSTYGTTAANMIDGAWSELYSHVSIQPDPDGVSTQKVLLLNSNPDTGRVNYARIVLPTARPTIGLSARYWYTSVPASDLQEVDIAVFTDVDNRIHGYVSVLATGALAIYGRYDEAFGGQYHRIAYTAGPVTTAGSWYHIETKAVVSGTTGMTITVKVEGVQKLTGSFTSTHTINGNIAQLWVRNHGDTAYTGPGCYVKDFVVWDDQGSENNDFLGRVKVYNCHPDGDDTLTMSIVGGQTYGYQVLSNNPYDDAKYLSSNVANIGSTNIFTMSDLPSTVSSVKAVMSYVRAGKADSGDGTMQAGVVSSGTGAVGLDRPLPASQTYWYDVFELDPNTTGHWTRTTVNAAKLKFTRTS